MPFLGFIPTDEACGGTAGASLAAAGVALYARDETLLAPDTANWGLLDLLPPLLSPPLLLLPPLLLGPLQPFSIRGG